MKKLFSAILTAAMIVCMVSVGAMTAFAGEYYLSHAYFEPAAGDTQPATKNLTENGYYHAFVIEKEGGLSAVEEYASTNDADEVETLAKITYDYGHEYNDYNPYANCYTLNDSSSSLQGGKVTISGEDAYLVVYYYGEDEEPSEVVVVSSRRDWLEDPGALKFDTDEEYNLTNGWKSLKAPHTHTFSTEWSKNETGHWHECTAEGCTITNYATCGIAGAAYDTHSYNGNGFCDSCGAKDPSALVPDILLDTVWEGHMQTMDIEVQGTYYTLSIDAYGAYLDHDYGGDYYWCESCTDDTIKFKDPSNDWNTFTLNYRTGYCVWDCYYGYFEGDGSGALNHVHAFSTEWSYNETAHWHACTAEDCDIEDYATCGIAGAAYAEHSFVNNACVCGMKQIEMPMAEGGLTYNGEEQIGVAEGEGYTVTNGKKTDAGEYTATASVKDGYIWTDGTPFDIMIDWTIYRASNGIHGDIKQAGWTCGETPAAADLSDVEAIYGTPVAVYYTEESCTNKIDPASITVAGTYYVRAEVEETNNYAACESDVVSFTVEEAMAGPTTLKLTSIRTKDIPGLRFAAYVTAEQREDSDSYGFLVARETADLIANPKHLVFNDAKSTSGTNTYGVTYTSGAAYDKANDIDKIYSEDGEPFGMPDVEATFFTGVMINIPEAYYAEHLIARSYIVVDGVTLYGETYVKSLYENACAIRDGGYEGLDEDGIEYIDSIIYKVNDDVAIDIDDLLK